MAVGKQNSPSRWDSPHSLRIQAGFAWEEKRPKAASIWMSISVPTSLVIFTPVLEAPGVCVQRPLSSDVKVLVQGGV